MTHGPVTATLLISCRDQRGLVAAVSTFLFRHSGNIIHADQHTDPEEGIFLQRVEWVLAGFDIPRERIADAFTEEVASRFGLSWRLQFSDRLPRIALFTSRLPHCLYDLLARWRMGEIRAEIPLIVSNHDDHRDIANDFGVAFHHLPMSELGKVEQEARALELLDSANIGLVVLARYMQVLSPSFVERYESRILNIHHSFLPAFAGAKPYHQAHLRGVKIIGATAHYVTKDLDEGPIIAQDVAHVSHRDDVDAMVRKGRDLEKVVLARAVRLHLDSRILVYKNKTVVFD